MANNHTFWNRTIGSLPDDSVSPVPAHPPITTSIYLAGPKVATVTMHMEDYSKWL